MRTRMVTGNDYESLPVHEDAHVRDDDLSTSDVEDKLPEIAASTTLGHVLEQAVFSRRHVAHAKSH